MAAPLLPILQPELAANSSPELGFAPKSEAAAGLVGIARLAAEGLSNKAIAEQVFVSIKTVESNLKRAYRKLDISSRAQLARALDRLDAQAIS